MKSASPNWAIWGFLLSVIAQTLAQQGDVDRMFAEQTRTKAERGDAVAQCEFGLLLLSGVGVTKDFEQAVNWLRKSADQANAKAEYNLGVCYERGESVSKDFVEAVAWYRKAADKGYAKAQSNLGVCYYNGWGVRKSLPDAAAWYRKAAEQGHARAQRNLGVCYALGTGVAKDLVEAAKWYGKAAEFYRRCTVAKIAGVSLHSYRYAWAERAFRLGYPERFAQAALGHGSRAVHHSYARKAKVLCPSLDQFRSG